MGGTWESKHDAWCQGYVLIFYVRVHGKMNPTAPGPYWLIIIPHIPFPNCQGGPLESYGGTDGLLISWSIRGQALMKGKSIESIAPNHALSGILFLYSRAHVAQE